jgi:hypothetical protein
VAVLVAVLMLVAMTAPIAALMLGWWRIVVRLRRRLRGRRVTVLLRRSVVMLLWRCFVMLLRRRLVMLLWRRLVTLLWRRLMTLWLRHLAVRLERGRRVMVRLRLRLRHLALRLRMHLRTRRGMRSLGKARALDRR